MGFGERLTKTLKSWWQREAPPQEPPVPGRPGGQVGNSRRTGSTKGESVQAYTDGSTH